MERVASPLRGAFALLLALQTGSAFGCSIDWSPTKRASGDAAVEDAGGPADGAPADGADASSTADVSNEPTPDAAVPDEDAAALLSDGEAAPGEDAAPQDGPCNLDSCLHGGSCVLTTRGPRCACTSAWSGPTCEDDVDECAGTSQVCTPDFPCVNGAGSYTCRGMFADWPVRSRATATADFVLDTGEGTVLDNLSGLRWQRAAASADTLAHARAYCAGLSADGGAYHLPSLAEWGSLLNTPAVPDISAAIFPDSSALPYWTSTPANPPITDASGRAVFTLRTTDLTLDVVPPSGSARARCVRADGVRAAVSPVERLEANAGVVHDLNTGLYWQQNSEDDLRFDLAVDRCTQLHLEGRVWRMPRLAEMLSLVDPLQPFLRVSTIFTGWTADWFWTSDGARGSLPSHYVVNLGLSDSQFTIQSLADADTVGSPVRCVSGP